MKGRWSGIEDVATFVRREFGEAVLGDVRLKARLQKIAEGMTCDPSRSIPQAMGDWAATKAAYRFFANPDVNREKVLEGHVQSTVRRLRGEEAVLVIEDTTSLNFSHHPATQGLGKIGAAKWPNQLEGALVHSALAVSMGSHRVLGLLDQQVILRKGHHPADETKVERHRRARESRKWMTSSRRVVQRVSGVAAAIFVFDREGDVFEGVEDLQQQGARFVIRASQNRRLETTGAGPAYLLDRIRGEPGRGQTTVSVQARGGRKERTADLTLRAGTYWISPPRIRAQKGQPREISVVYASEETAPTGVEPLEWVLLTSEPVEEVAQIVTVLQHYSARWKIEEWHKVLKTGCRLESRQLEKWERLEVLLAIFSVIAWRLLALRDAARGLDVPLCEEVLEEAERFLLRTLDRAGHDFTKASAYLRALARLGGFLDRRRDDEPGWITIWRGYSRMCDIRIGFELAESRRRSG